ncbi:MAG: lipocalin family protein [Methylococcales bacterium]
MKSWVIRRILPAAAGILIILGLGFYFMPDLEQHPVAPRNLHFLPAIEETNLTPPSSERLVFPGDHGIHRQTGSEVWQLLGHLETINGGRFGFEVTLLRIDLGTDLSQRRSAWATDQIFHLSYAITPFLDGEIYRDQETSRRAMGLAGYDPQQRKIWIYKRALKFHESDPKLPVMELSISDSAYPARLEFSTAKPVVVPSLSTPFRYYAITRMKAQGNLKISGKNQMVSGEAFFDHSWGKIPGGGGQLVRNRFMLQLSNGIDLNLLQSRRRDGTGNAVNTGFLVLSEGETLFFEPGDLNIDPNGHWTSEASGIRYPVQWRIQIPERDLELDLKPWMDNQETADSLIDWSGMVSVSGHSGATPVNGFGHVQLSGHSPHNSKKIPDKE